MRNKKILFVATVAGHINTFHLPYIQMLKDEGYEVHVATRRANEVELADKKYDISFERFPIKLKNIQAYRELKKIIDENQYDIIHCHTPVGGVLARLAARKIRKNGTKVIYTAHGFHFYKGAPLINWIIYYPIEKICARWTDCLITITNEDYEFAKKHLKTERIEHTHGIGVNVENFTKIISEKEKKEKKKEFSIKNEDFVFSYVAELNENKNQKLLINVIKELKKENSNIKLLLVGQGALLEKYKKIINDNDLSENIKLLGRRKDINEILSITDIYLASSLREGLPINVMEAMCKGLPIIAMDNRGHRELVKDDENGFIIKTREQMKQKIEKILCDKELKQRLIENGKEKSKKYEISTIIKSVEKIYKSIIK